MIGHNGAPFDFFDFFDIVTSSSATTAEKLIALIHARQIARRNGASYLSRNRVLSDASLSDRTYQRALPTVRLFLDCDQNRGRATVWKPRSDITEEGLEAAIQDLREQAKAHDKSISQNGVYPKTTRQNGVSSTSQNGVTPYAKLAGHKDQFKEKEKETPIAPKSEHQSSSVWMGEDGVPQVVNGKRQALEKILAGKADIDTALKAVAEKVDAQGDLWASVAAEVATYAAGLKRKRNSPPEEYHRDFEEFWKLYPRREGKGAAYKVWQRLNATQKERARVALNAQLHTLSAKARDPRGNFCPHPATWINQGRFDDGLPDETGSPAKQKPADMPDFVWRKIQEDEARAAAAR